MKNSIAIKFIAGLALVAGLSGCKKTLEEYNPSGTTAETVYNTPIGYESLIAASYSYNRHWYGKEDGLGLSELGSDLWVLGEQGYNAANPLVLDNRPLQQYTNINASNLNVRRLWRRLYQAINLCNTGIKIKTDGEGFNPDDSKVAELKFLRAWYYFHVVQTWGGVYLTTEPTTSPTTTATKSSVAAFYDQIINDLNDAIQTLPATSVEAGRVNINVAKALLARVYLTRGYINNSATDFTAARDLAQQVINSGKYSLVSNYQSMWGMSIASQKNTEVIWSVNYALDYQWGDVYNETSYSDGYGVDIPSASGKPTSGRGNNSLHAVFISLYDKAHDSTGNQVIVGRDIRNGWPFNRVRPTKYLMDVFDETRDQRFKGSFQTVWKVNYQARVGRLVGKTPYVDTAMLVTKHAPASTKYYTIDVYNTYNADGTCKAQFTQNGQWFPTLWKFQDSTRFVTGTPSDAGSGDYRSSKDVQVIRLSEMYIIAAEAELQLSNTGAAATQLNILRDKRAITPGALTITAADVTLDFILDERAREFAGENMRWFDLKRVFYNNPQGFKDRLTAKNPDIASAFLPMYMLRPIPQQQLDAVTNKSEFTQNPGY